MGDLWGAGSLTLPKVGTHLEPSPGTSSKAPHLHGKVFPVNGVF